MTCEDDTTVDGLGKGHTNLIGDSCLTKDIKQGQKKIISSTSGKPILQFIRQNVSRSSKDNTSVDPIDKEYRTNETQGETKDSTHSKESTQDTFLAAGKAERAFFTVCLEGNNEQPVHENTNSNFDVASKQETISLDSKYSENDEEKAKSIKVVNEILGEIEIDHQRQQIENDTDEVDKDLIDINDSEIKYSNNNIRQGSVEVEEAGSQASFKASDKNNLKKEENTTQAPEKAITQNEKSEQSITDAPPSSRSIARSLVVDIHIPPNEDERFYISEMSSTPIDGTQDSTFARKEDSSFRPCKHEVNRSQRCYSDTSHLDKKRKYKVYFRKSYVIRNLIQHFRILQFF